MSNYQVHTITETSENKQAHKTSFYALPMAWKQSIKSSYLVLTPNIPNGEADVLVFYSLYIETCKQRIRINYINPLHQMKEAPRTLKQRPKILF